MTLVKQFLDDNFLIANKTAAFLYHDVAVGLPIIDYHNHIDPKHIHEDKSYANISELWLKPDPYKHRLMRMCGIPEAKITGDASDKEKFLNWATVFPNVIGNPLYHWSCLELQRIFDIDILLSEDTAEEIWNICNAKLQEPGFTASGILRAWNVEAMCTSDDLIDDIDIHKQATDRLINMDVRPSLRGDAIVSFKSNDPGNWHSRLTKISNSNITDLETYKSAIIDQMSRFEQAGCLMSDHALNAGFRFIETSEDIANRLFDKYWSGQDLSTEEQTRLQSHILVYLGKEYGKRNWIMQLHIGAQRHTSTRLRTLAGKAGGYACIGSSCDIASLTSFLDTIERTGHLPRIILYTLNPADYEGLASMTGSYAEGGVSGKIQLGPAWWYNDHLDGIRRHLSVLTNYSLISSFIGMTTDSRSMLSFSRHEYFRRVLCNCIGEWAENGFMPQDKDVLSQLVENISYRNIKKWFS